MNDEIEAPRALSYDPITIRLHWATAGLVAVLWTMGRTTGRMRRGPLRIDVWSVHILLGLSLAGVHGVFYALLLAIVALGMANVLVRGFPMVNLWSLPKLGDEAAARMITSGMAWWPMPS